MAVEYLNKIRMHCLYASYLESSYLTDFKTWLERRYNFTPYQINRLIRFSKSEYAKTILHSHAWD